MASMGTTDKDRTAAQSLPFRQSKNKNRVSNLLDVRKAISWLHFGSVLYDVMCAGQSGRKGTEHPVILWWHLLLASSNLGEFLCLFGKRGTARGLPWGREESRIKLCWREEGIWWETGNIMAPIWKDTKTATEVKAGKEIGDDLWSTLLAKDRIMDIES